MTAFKIDVDDAAVRAALSPIDRRRMPSAEWRLLKP